VKIPVIGIGGIMTASDALEFLIVGARAVPVGPATFGDPAALVPIIDGIEAFLVAEGLEDINQVIGSLQT
jgi:dihydroorotate dehydrogenase (NAD+) catalytic subunit